MILLLLLFAPFMGPDYHDAVLLLSGAGTLEELSEEEIELYDDLSKHPVDINNSSRSKLLSCGLFTRFQVASLIEYRQASGDVLSLAELALVDGFNPRLVDALSHFISIRTRLPASHRDALSFRQDVVLASSLRSSDQEEAPESTYKVKYHARLGSMAELYWTSRNSYSDPQASLGTISAAFYGKRHLGKLVLGHYSARFGQGLNQWSGFSLSGFSSISAFNRRASGLAATSSASAEHIGIASDWELGSLGVSAAADLASKECVAHLDWSGRNLSLGSTLSSTATSADWRYGFADMSLFGEASWHYDKSIAAVAGMLWVPRYGRSLALQLRYYSPEYKEYSGIALGYSDASAFASVDLAVRDGKQQYKLLAQWKPSLVLADSLGLKPQMRVSLRYRPAESAPLRADIRLDNQLSLGPFLLALRYNALWCRGFAHMAYLQLGRRTEALTISARATVYRVDNWDDRIYVYEQDAPGTFNVPALYGRGWKASVFAAWHINRSHSLWLRLEYRPDRTELKLQYRWR